MYMLAMRLHVDRERYCGGSVNQRVVPTAVRRDLGVHCGPIWFPLHLVATPSQCSSGSGGGSGGGSGSGSGSGGGPAVAL